MGSRTHLVSCRLLIQILANNLFDSVDRVIPAAATAEPLENIGPMNMNRRDRRLSVCGMYLAPWQLILVRFQTNAVMKEGKRVGVVLGSENAIF